MWSWPAAEFCGSRNASDSQKTLRGEPDIRDLQQRPVVSVQQRRCNDTPTRAGTPVKTHDGSKPLRAATGPRGGVPDGR
ncbi:hypothetical protein EYF80_048131 [Liparis tanakae]|uniref:Uncharacterized protein n=1 Tax=Liparis tanakae TaxID=230148 RepID=A0A4Z2FKC8_9TELE|nr:hypothetical protein EYF80_048131 [Liparis tanakae]